MSRYRIVRDDWNGFEVQIKRWWFPFWIQCGVTNTHTSVEAARDYAFQHANGFPKTRGVVDYLGDLTPIKKRPLGRKECE